MYSVLESSEVGSYEYRKQSHVYHHDFGAEFEVQMSYETLVERVNRYGRMLDDEGKVEHAMNRLEKLPLTLELLRESGVGRAMGKLRKSKKFGDRATAIVNRWKELAQPPSSVSSNEQAKVVKAEVHEDRASEHRTVKRSFEPVIEMEQKRMKPLPILAMEDIQPTTKVPPSHSSSNFIPVKLDIYDPSVFTRKMTNRDTLRKRGIITLVNGEVPRLFDTCLKTCISNIDGETIGFISQSIPNSICPFSDRRDW